MAGKRYSTNGGGGHRVCKMCHRKVGVILPGGFCKTCKKVKKKHKEIQERHNDRLLRKWGL